MQERGIDFRGAVRPRHARLDYNQSRLKFSQVEPADLSFSNSCVLHADLYTAFHSQYYAQQLEQRYGVNPASGYWFALPEFQDRPWDEFVDEFGSNYIVVPLHHLHFGLRFPVHWFLQVLLCEYEVCLAQVTPMSLRGVIGWIWLCEFFNFPLTMNLFRACFDFRPAGNNATYWYAFYAANGTNTQFPKDPNLHEWRTKYALVRIPDDGSFFAPRRFCVALRTPAWTSRELKTQLNPYELQAYRFFCYTKEHWLPHYWAMTREPVLVLGGLSRAMSEGNFHLFRSILVPQSFYPRLWRG